MSQLNPEIVTQVVEACKATAEDVASAFQRALDVEVTLSVGEPDTVEPAALSAEVEGPGLVVVLTVGEEAALVLLPESSGILPAWYRDPDPTGRSKLETLAQELAFTILPDDHAPEEFTTVAVTSVADTVTQAALAEAAARVPLELATADGKSVVAHLVWPAANPKGVTAAAPQAETPAETPSETPAEPAAQPAAASTPQESPAEAPQKRETPSASHAPKRETPAGARSVHDLPHYTRSLLKISVPVMVTLARKTQSLGRILELGPGSIIQFDKSYEEMLELNVGGRAIATGEAVKVGEKFGLRINSIILPGERFRRVRTAATAGK